MNEESGKIDDMLKRGKISTAQAEKLRQALPSATKKTSEIIPVRRMKWAGWGMAGIAGISLLVLSQWQIHGSTKRIESNLEALRKQGFVSPTHFQVAIPKDTGGSELAYEKDGQRLGLPLKSTDVQVDIHTDVARVFVTQLYVNNTDQVLEARYVFPLPENSAVDSMIMTVGTKRIHGKILKRDEARKTYEQARDAGKTASLLEQERPNVFTQNIANILPQDSIVITISFLQEINFMAPFYYYHFPTVVGPRYLGHTPDAARINAPVANPNDPTFTSQRPRFNLDLRLQAGVPIRNLESASHKLSIESLQEKEIRLHLASADSLADKDFLLKYQLAGETIAPSLQAEGDHFKVTVLPQFDALPENVFNRELVFVMDVSGSMSGYPVEKSKEVIGHLLRNMLPQDRFRLVTFASGTEELSQDALPSTKANIKLALNFVSDMRGGGGTEMLAAVKKVFAFRHREDRRRLFLFLTDGYIGNEIEIIKAIGENVGDSRVFTLGVGSSVNRYLLECMARVGRGVARYIRHDEDAESAMKEFYTTIESPVLTNLSLQWNDIQVTDVIPSALPDLYLGHPLTLLGKYRGNERGTLTLTGLLPGGKKYQQSLAIDFSTLPASSLAVKALWARSKVNDLELEHTGMLGNAPTSPDSAKAQIENLGLQYRIMTAYTSFVAVLDQVRNSTGEWVPVDQVVELPAGMSADGAATQSIEGSPVLTWARGSLSHGRLGARKGRIDGGFNEAYATGGSSGGEDLLSGLWGTGTPAPPKSEADSKVKALVGHGLKSPNPTDIVMVESSGQRTAESLLRVIRQHMLSLRHTYNKHLKSHSGFVGKIVFTFTIATDGSISELVLVSSTTGVVDFDREIRDKIKSWRFESTTSKSRDVITVPFNFSE